MTPLSLSSRLVVAALALALGCAESARGGVAQSRKLAAGETATRELEGGGAHLYALAMRAGEYLHVTVEQRGVANCLYRLAYIHSHYGEMRESIELYEQSLAISREMGDRSTGAITLFSIGLDYAHLGDTRKTFEYLLPALEMRLELGNRRGAANVLNAVGAVYASTGESRKALESFQRALELYRAVADRGGEILTLDNIGCVHASVGDSRKALDYFGQALEVLRATERRASELGTLELIDDKYFSLNDLQKVLDDNSRAFVLTRAHAQARARREVRVSGAAARRAPHEGTARRRFARGRGADLAARRRGDADQGEQPGLRRAHAPADALAEGRAAATARRRHDAARIRARRRAQLPVGVDGRRGRGLRAARARED